MDGKGVSFGTGEIEDCIVNNEDIDSNINTVIKKQGILDGSTRIFDDISILGVELF
jgi:hypothetical protein